MCPPLETTDRPIVSKPAARMFPGRAEVAPSLRVPPPDPLVDSGLEPDSPWRLRIPSRPVVGRSHRRRSLRRIVAASAARAIRAKLGIRQSDVTYVGPATFFRIPAVGEPVTPVAFVRYASVGCDRCHLTVDVEVWDRKGRRIAAFAMGAARPATTEPGPAMGRAA